jgi:transglutaminase-like putative cysteine protease
MSFESYFRACSYAMVASGVLALAVSGGVGVWLAAGFAAVLAVSWRLAATRWQLSERAGMYVVLLALPAFYLDWRFQRGMATDTAGQVYAGVSALVHFTLLLSSIKLLQVKSDRDWLFLYLISFFEVLLAAGLSVSPLFLLSLALYVFTALLAVVCFELRKSARLVPQAESRLLVANDAKFLRRWRRRHARPREARALGRLPLAVAFLFLAIFGLALPVFLITPRASEGTLSMPGGAASSGFVGFSDRVTLGEIGRLNQSNQLVMRVRVEGPAGAGSRGLRWRGVALDRFDGRRWMQTDRTPNYLELDGNLYGTGGKTEDITRLTTQTFFVEPLDTPVVFAAPRALALQGAFPYVRRDKDDGLHARPHDFERITYTVYSDTYEPPPERLRMERAPDPSAVPRNLRRPVEDYLQLPATLDTRVGSLAWGVVSQARARTVYDQAHAVEEHLSRNAYGGDYRYSLEMRAGGSDPLSDFLFNVRAGHCEYFATAMAIMLRTLRIPARVVNGFQPGEYNPAADAYVVRQADAHSWVEVYFADADAWVTFDPTPADGRPAGTSGEGLTGSLRRYADALELFWIQHVVAYDRKDQRALVRTLSSQFNSYSRAASDSADGIGTLLSAWLGGRASSGLLALTTSPYGIASAGLLLFGLGFLWLRRGGHLRTGRAGKNDKGNATAAVEFYRRMNAALAARGLTRNADQTPLEFAEAVGTPEALVVTGAYNRVRFGAGGLTEAEAAEVERCLRRMEESNQ